jgi:hypothetical protein
LFRLFCAMQLNSCIFWRKTAFRVLNWYLLLLIQLQHCLNILLRFQRNYVKVIWYGKP